MSEDVTRWCKKDKPASYTLLSIHHSSSKSVIANGEHLSVNVKQNLRQYLNRSRINRDIRNINRTCSDSDDFERESNHSFMHWSSQRCGKSYRLLNIWLIIVLYIMCNELITSVSCDELNESVGTRGHFTHTWAVHIPGGDEIAEKVATDHDMYLRGKVSQNITTYANLYYVAMALRCRLMKYYNLFYFTH